MRKLFILALSFLASLVAFSQSDSDGKQLQHYSNHEVYIDQRDNKSYQTIKLGETVWIAENLKFKTENSEEHIDNLSQIKYDGYYYPLEEIDAVCPDGFRIPTTTEWEAYVKLILELRNISEEEMKYSRLNKKGNEYVIGLLADELLQPFESPNPLNIKDHGHTQNGNIIALGTFNIWIKHDSSSDPKYHLHLDNDGFLIHTHKHHIIDKKKKRRKFSIRCVSEK